MSGRIVFRCSQCEKVHEGLPAITFDAPSHYNSLTLEERAARGKLSSDFCVVDDEAYYVRAVLVIPIIGETEALQWGVWGSLSEENFMRYGKSFEDADQSKVGPLFSWFASSLPGYTFDKSLPCNLLPQDNRQRPLVDFHLADTHPLALDQKNGISVERAIEFAMLVLHKH